MNASASAPVRAGGKGRSGQADKSAVVTSLGELFKDAKALVFTDFTGLTAPEMVVLRRHFRRQGLTFRVVKNTLAQRAAAQAGLALDAYFRGATGVAISRQDPILACKLVMELATQYEKKYRIKGALVEGATLDAKGVLDLATLPSRPQLLSQLVLSLQAPITGLVTVLEGLMREFVGTLDAVRQRRADATDDNAQGGGKMPTVTQEQFLQAIDEMTVKELADFVAALKEKYGVTAAVMAAPVAAGGSPAAAPAAAEKTAFKVVLKNAGQQKVQLIKVVKEITGKGLKESKELVDKLPAVIKEGIPEDEANKIKEQLVAAGAEIEMQ